MDESGLLNVSLSLRPIAGSRKITGVLQALAAAYGKEFRAAGTDTWVRSGRNRMEFTEEGGFQVLFGIRRCNKKGEEVCGDSFSFANYNKKRAVMLLSDGMGVGRAPVMTVRNSLKPLRRCWRRESMRSMPWKSCTARC